MLRDEQGTGVRRRKSAAGMRSVNRPSGEVRWHVTIGREPAEVA